MNNNLLREKTKQLLEDKNLNKEMHDRYRNILNNLLDINPQDSSINTKINNKYFFDIYKKFGHQFSSLLWNKKDFYVPLYEIEFKILIEKLRHTKNSEEILAICKDNNLSLSTKKERILKKDFTKGKQLLIDIVEAQAQKNVTTWKLFLNKALEINSEGNIWPLHLGFGFVSVKIEEREIFAPLFLKEVTLEIKNSVPILKSNGEIKLNEKLFWFLNNAGFSLSLDFNYSEDSISEFCSKVENVWRETFNFKIDILHPLEPASAASEKLTFHDGIVLGLFQPLGGYVRNRMIEIITNGDMDNIFKVEFNKKIVSEKISKTIFKENFGFYKLVPSNYSQDKAVVSALNQDTIIWGPPGTGKSQTLVNILVNILAFDKKALVVSQKKAALLVLGKRLHTLKQFCLFLLNDKNVNRKQFYKPIVEYLERLENFQELNDTELVPILSLDAREYLNNVKLLLAYKDHQELFKIFAELTNLNGTMTKEDFNTLYNLETSIKYPFPFNKNLSTFSDLAKINKLSKFLQITKVGNKAKLIQQISQIINQHLQNFNGDLNKFSSELKKHSFSLYKTLFKIRAFKKQKTKSENFEKHLSSLVFKKIFDQIDMLDRDSQLYKKYINFAAAARLGTLSPHKFLHDFSEVIKILFPVIITTPDTDLSSWKKEEFDYALLDESSQIFLEKGIPILYLAKIKILAGDNQQMKPTRWFVTRSYDDSLLSSVNSLLDYGMSMGVHTILLDKNYRSNSASLMTFSSKHFYKSKLDVVTTFKALDKQAIEVFEVNGKWGNGLNLEEIQQALKLVEKYQKVYQKIVILAFNSKQQEGLEREIFSKYPAFEDLINQEKLVLRNIENIQGDEADLVIATLGYDQSSKIHATYIGRDGGMNALNVAISRAKDKMIVLKSIRAEDLGQVEQNENLSLFKKWLYFLELSAQEQQNYLENVESNTFTTKEIVPTSDFKNEVLNHFDRHIHHSRSYKLHYAIGSMNADIAIFENEHLDRLVLIDDFSYAFANSTFEDYALFQDRLNFLKAKDYRVDVIDPLTHYAWEKEVSETTVNDNFHPEKIVPHE